ncbi:MAG: hypothetical protein FWD67_12565 [Betaproteobacteria bacterium]|nr:hypothetical protein [Betaproteobacteria bacterium]
MNAVPHKGKTVDDTCPHTAAARITYDMNSSEEMMTPSKIRVLLLLAAVALAVRSTVAAAEGATPVVEVRNGPRPGAVELRANQAVDLAAELMVEWQRDDGSFKLVKELDLGSLKLLASCGQQVGACVRIDERGLRPVPWTGMSCSAQCTLNCDGNVRLSGRFRFVVTTCDGKQRFEGPVFELPPDTER